MKSLKTNKMLYKLYSFCIIGLLFTISCTNGASKEISEIYSDNPNHESTFGVSSSELEAGSRADRKARFAQSTHLASMFKLSEYLPFVRNGRMCIQFTII